MERVDRIIRNETFIWNMKKLLRLEQERIYCRHDMDHLLSVARIAYIKALEERIPVSKELIYAAALLHDIGRAAQYETGIPHDRASVGIAEEILRDCGFTGDEQAEILSAISSHRSKDVAGESLLGTLIYDADKKSRACFMCKAQASCNWPMEKKNYNIKR
ncbi:MULTISPECIES: HD domain-containing protein [unclassified Candidatus Paralachnospira]|uniref:HD domain-containing protein n=1 Tax=unclassified Candidatus Paralachnospira TaxID=3099471 RepID=UPI003F8DAB0D